MSFGVSVFRIYRDGNNVKNNLNLIFIYLRRYVCCKKKILSYLIVRGCSFDFFFEDTVSFKSYSKDFKKELYTSILSHYIIMIGLLNFPYQVVISKLTMPFLLMFKINLNFSDTLSLTTNSQISRDCVKWKYWWYLPILLFPISLFTIILGKYFNY